MPTVTKTLDAVHLASALLWQERTGEILTFLLFQPIGGYCQSGVPPYDLWTSQVKTEIRNQSTLETKITPNLLYSEVYYTSNSAVG